MTQETVHMRGTVVADTERGVLVRIHEIGATDAPKGTEEWLPKSQLIVDPKHTDLYKLARGEVLQFELPAWVALERGLFDD